MYCQNCASTTCTRVQKKKMVRTLSATDKNHSIYSTHHQLTKELNKPDRKYSWKLFTIILKIKFCIYHSVESLRLLEVIKLIIQKRIPMSNSTCPYFYPILLQQNRLTKVHPFVTFPMSPPTPSPRTKFYVQIFFTIRSTIFTFPIRGE